VITSKEKFPHIVIFLILTVQDLLYNTGTMNAGISSFFYYPHL